MADVGRHAKLDRDWMVKANERLAKLERQMDKERQGLAAARLTWREAQLATKSSPVAANVRAEERAKLAVEAIDTRLKQLRLHWQEAREQRSDARILEKIAAAEAAVNKKLEERVSVLHRRADADLAKARIAFERQFMKKREAENRRKLAEIERALRVKHRHAVKQLASKLRQPEALRTYFPAMGDAEHGQ